MIPITNLRTNMKISFKGELFTVVEFQHVNPGNKRAFVRTRLKNMKTGQVLEQTFRYGDPIEEPDFEEREVQYLYKEVGGFQFMDKNSFEQVYLTEEQLGNKRFYLEDNIGLTVRYHNGEPIDIVLPIFVELKVEKTDPGVRGDTATGGTKAARLETGLTLQVPLFLSEGERIKVDTRTGDYVERVK